LWWLDEGSLFANPSLKIGFANNNLMGCVFQIGTHSPEAVISSATLAINLRIPESVFLGEGASQDQD
jgi:hypothetical protein